MSKTFTANLISDPLTSDVAAKALLRPPSARSMANVKRMLQAHTAGHAWTISPGGTNVASSNLNDTSSYLLGTQSVLLTTPSTQAANAYFQVSGQALDATGCDLRVYFWYDNLAALSLIKVYAGDSTLTNNYHATVTDLSSSNPSVTTMTFPEFPGTWAYVDIPWSAMTTSGTPTRSALDTVRIQVMNKAGTPLNFRIAGAATVLIDEGNRWPNGVVTISFDDCRPGQKTLAIPYLDKYGYRATFFPIIGATGPNTLTTDDLKKLRDRGHEIGAHASSTSVHATGVAGMNEPQLVAELEILRQWQVTNNFASDSYAYPNGYWSPAAAEIVSRFYRSARLAFTLLPSSVRPENQWRIRAYNGGSQYSSLSAALTQVQANKGWLHVIYHDVQSSGATGIAANIADFQTFIDSVAAAGVPVRTQGEVVAAGV